MKVYVISDSHGDFDTLNSIFKKSPRTDMIIFLGDGLKEIYDISSIYDIPLLTVRGNNDPEPFEPYERVEEICGHRIFITHGHIYKIYKGKEPLIKKAKELNCKTVLFGHTHVQYYEKAEGVTLFNPGAIKYGRSPSKKGYGILTISRDKIDFKHIELNNNPFTKLRNFSLF